jgi:hypothetical protein
MSNLTEEDLEEASMEKYGRFANPKDPLVGMLFIQESSRSYRTGTIVDMSGIKAIVEIDGRPRQLDCIKLPYELFEPLEEFEKNHPDWDWDCPVKLFTARAEMERWIEEQGWARIPDRNASDYFTDAECDAEIKRMRTMRSIIE